MGYLPLVPVEYDDWKYQAVYCNVFGCLVFRTVLLLGPDLLPGWFMCSEEVLPGQGVHPPGRPGVATGRNRISGRLLVLLLELGRSVPEELHKEALDRV